MEHPRNANFAQDSMAPLPSAVDTGLTLVDKANVDQFIAARNAAATGK